jgi:hypothetical protein
MSSIYLMYEKLLAALIRTFLYLLLNRAEIVFEPDYVLLIVQMISHVIWVHSHELVK